MPAAASDRPISARGCCRATIRRRSARWRCGSTSSTPSAAPSSARCSTRRSRASRALYGPDRKGLPSALVVESEGWHVGVIGIVASRLVERYRPAGLRHRHGWRAGQGIGPLGAGRRSRRGGDRGPAGRACWSTAAAMPWRPASPWPRSGWPISRSSSTTGIAPQLGVAPADARARHRCRPGAGCGDAGAGRHDRAGWAVRRRQCPAALRAHLGTRQPRAAGGRGPCALLPGRRRARPHRGDRLPRQPDARSGPHCSIRHGPCCMSRAHCASTATAAAKACACRSTTPPRRRAQCWLDLPAPSRYMLPLF